MTKIDYAKNTWCRKCEILNSLDDIFCKECGKRVRRSTHQNKNQKEVKRIA